VRNNPEFDFRFDNKHIPNIYAAAVIFTGKLYQTASPQCTWDWQCSYGYYYDDYYFNSLAIHYRQEDSSLELNIEPDKERYQPGDVAKISVTVKKNKLPTPNAQVNLILVDQALEAIGGVKKPSVLGSLYKTVPNEIYYNYNSHKPVFNISPASERGGGGGEDRQIFKDTPFFGQTRTNEEGVATFEFTLSDNITTWLIYAQSLSGNFDAGQAEGRLIASKDFFVTSNFPKEYLQKDTSFITGNGFGESIGQSQTISYEARIFKGENELHKLAGDGKALKDTSFQLPGLNTGDYRVWLKGTTNDLVDGVIYPFSVIQSRLDLQMENKFKIEKGKALNSIELAGLNNQKPIKMIITDAGRGQYYYQLYNFCFTSSNRIEKKLAKTTANSIINERFAEEPCKARVDELSAFQNFDGGISQVSWGGSDLETTVWAIYVNKDAFDKDKLTAYLEDELNRTRTGSVQKIYAYWGLTLLGKPHINELLFFAQNSTEFDERVISALALASIGETEVSRDIYFDLLADYAYTNKPYIRIQSKTNVGSHALIDKYVYDTSLALLLGSIVEKNYNEGLYLYLRDYQNQVEDIVLDLGKISFINEELGKLPLEDTQVFFRSNLRQETFDLSKGRQKSINLLKDEIDNVSISVNLGKADVGVFYYATADIFSQMKKDKRLSIKREIKKIKSDNDPIRPGDIIQVKIDFDLNTLNAPLGGYTITDHLPSGLTYIENPGIYGFTQKGWVWQDTNNVIRYVFYNSPWWQNYGEHSFTYFARASAVGTYTAEPCIIQSRLDLSVIQSTPEEVIKIESSD
jgi:alpha-2-macroglobulin